MRLSSLSDPQYAVATARKDLENAYSHLSTGAVANGTRHGAALRLERHRHPGHVGSRRPARAGQYLYEQTGLAELATSVGDRTADLETTIHDSGVDAELVTSYEEGVR
jgi:hypothetical protein